MGKMTLSNFIDPSVDLTGKSVLVTGGTGSFGQCFVRTVLENHSPRRVVVFSRDEAKQHDMHQTLGGRENLRFFIGDVRDLERLSMAMREIDIVVHAAALKQVPTAEYNPFECIKTNVHGAEHVVQAALNNQVESVIALSTDKAVNPINLYGASKLAADKIFVAANNLSGNIGTRFAIVRYGNVLGSRGSVVPLFEKCMAEGAESLPITDPRMTRFWITLEMGVNFVLSCLAITNGGEIFVPKIPSLTIIDLATFMAPDLKHRVVGIRPGEKLHEVLITEDDARTTVELDDRFVIMPSLVFWDRSHGPDLNGTPVAEDFRYASDSNRQKLDEKAFNVLMKAAGA